MLDILPYEVSTKRGQNQFGLNPSPLTRVKGKQMTINAVNAPLHFWRVTENELEETRWVDQLTDAHEPDLVIIGSMALELPTRESILLLEDQVVSPRFRNVRVFPGIDPNLPATRL